MRYKLRGCVFGRASERNGHFSLRECLQRLCANAPVFTPAHVRWGLLETFEEPGRHSGQSVKVVVPVPPHCRQRAGMK